MIHYRVSLVMCPVHARFYSRKKVSRTLRGRHVVDGLLKHSSDEAEATRYRPSGEAKTTPEISGKWRVNAYPRAAVVPRKAPDSD